MIIIGFHHPLHDPPSNHCPCRLLLLLSLLWSLESPRAIVLAPRSRWNEIRVGPIRGPFQWVQPVAIKGHFRIGTVRFATLTQDRSQGPLGEEDPSDSRFFVGFSNGRFGHGFIELPSPLGHNPRILATGGYEQNVGMLQNGDTTGHLSNLSTRFPPLVLSTLSGLLTIHSGESMWLLWLRHGWDTAIVIGYC
jgi:hypothetical protein